MSFAELHTQINQKVLSAERAQRALHRSVAAGDLFDAILIAMSAEPDGFRKDVLTKLGQHCRQLRFEDLSLFAFAQAIREHESVGDYASAGTLMLEVGSLYARLANQGEASFWFQRAREASLAHSCYPNAASASTHLAMLAMDDEDWLGAYTLAAASLDYLQREPHPRTDAITRALLILLAEQLHRPMDEALAHARTLFGTLSGAPISDRLRQDVCAALERQAATYLTAHPSVDGKAWKHAQLPELWRGDA